MESSRIKNKVIILGMMIYTLYPVTYFQFILQSSYPQISFNSAQVSFQVFGNEQPRLKNGN